MTPVRLKVSYKTPESLLGELTKSVGRGGVRIETAKPVPVGTKFVFELRSPGVREAVEVHGTVLTVAETAPGKFALHIRYEPPNTRQGLDAVIRRIFETSQYDKHRKAPRIPLHVRATEDRADAPGYRLRDISAGGVGVDIESDSLPRHIKVGAPFTISMKLTTGMLSVQGQVVWAVTTRESDTLPPRVGIAWGELKPRVRELLDDLLTLKALPSPPWIARLTFG
ncbi:MAG: PilZ domain-containing protein [Archangium sp.]